MVEGRLLHPNRWDFALYIPWLIGLRSFYTTHDLQLSIIVSDLVQGISATLISSGFTMGRQFVPPFVPHKGP